MTPHNEARPGDFAPAVLLPGDPDRARWIAETLLEKARCVNRVRGEFGYTGTYRGLPVSIQATGMGRASMSIYVHELLTVYGVTTLVRIGSAGALDARVGLRSLILASSAVIDYEVGRPLAWHEPDRRLFDLTVARATADRLDFRVSPMVCSDVFYHPEPLGRFAEGRARGALACDMESSALYDLAARFGARGLSICTIVDSLVTGAGIEPEERQEVFGPMAKLALDALLDDRGPAGG